MEGDTQELSHPVLSPRLDSITKLKSNRSKKSKSKTKQKQNKLKKSLENITIPSFEGTIITPRLNSPRILSSPHASETPQSPPAQKLRVSTREIGDIHLLGFLLSIRTSVLRRMNMETIEIDKTSFEKAENLCILPVGETNEVIVKEFAGDVFEIIRRGEVQAADYIASWSNVGNQTSPSRSTGKSGASFMFSSDRKYLLKTLTAGECSTLVRILPAYFEHLKEHPNSLLSKFLGLYKVMDGKNKIYFTVIRNILDSTKMIKEKYDLKGSNVGRDRKKEAAPDSPMLDNDLKNRTISIESDTKSRFLKQLHSDALFLASQKLMDYSLLVGISDEPASDKPRKISKKKHTDSVPGMVYFKKPLKTDVYEKHTPVIGAPPPAVSAMKRQRKRFYVHSPHHLLSSSGGIPAPNGSSNSGSNSSALLRPDLPFSKPSTSHSAPSFRAISSPTLLFGEGFSSGPSSEFCMMHASESDEVYYIGIIDFLQRFNSKKKFAGFAKSLKHDKQHLSTVEPRFYAERFSTFIESIVK